jgi:hypothetical protein
MLNTTFLAVKQIAKDAEFILGKVAADCGRWQLGLDY